MRRVSGLGGWACVVVGIAGCRSWPAAVDRTDEVCAGSPDGVTGAAPPVPPAPVGPPVEVEAAVAGRAWRSPSVGVMKWIPPGTFTMGSPLTEQGRRDDEPQQTVTLTHGFWLMEHEVTQAEWQALTGSNPSSDAACGPSCPVTHVSWEEAVDFAGRLSLMDGVTYRLPTEAEWEYAARAGQDSVYAGGDTLESVGWYADNSGGHMHPVCGKPRNAFGLCDMSGNVWEWVHDRYGAHGAEPVTDPVGAEEGPDRVNRGGCWNGDAAHARAARRSVSDPGLRLAYLGLRLARSSP